jgi:hypothetical protein
MTKRRDFAQRREDAEKKRISLSPSRERIGSLSALSLSKGWLGGLGEGVCPIRRKHPSPS